MAHRWILSCTSAIVSASLLLPVQSIAADEAFVARPDVPDSQLVQLQPKSSALVQGFVHDPASEPSFLHDVKLKLLRQHIRYVFVLFQENRSFDQHFGTFPGAQGLFSKPAAMIPGFVQPIVNTDGSVGSISPFLVTQTVTDVNGMTVPLYPADTDSVDHSHTGINNSLDVQSATGAAANDRYALNEEGLTTSGGTIVSLKTGVAPTAHPTLLQKQRAELVMAHLDCDTVPFLWQFADRFTLFDNFYQTIIGPSTPNAIAMIAGQSGQTQWALHPETGSNQGNASVLQSGGEPVVADPGPYAGSNLDTSATKPPYGPNDVSPKTPALTQTYASLPLSFMGRSIEQTIKADQNPSLDLLDVQDDIRTIASNRMAPTNWGWYQEGYDHEPTDGSGAATNATYITHHNAPQYFGYVGDNTEAMSNLHGLGDFYADVSARRLPAQGGVFYVRGGYGNNDGLTPVDPNTAVQKAFPGSDDHPGYSDTQIAEALLADEVNAIAASPYWKDSAIIIAYDETDGLYDHKLPHFRELDPEGNPLAAGPRIPAIVISPYGRAHTISHEYAEHSSIIKFIDELFGLTPLADLPDEKKGRALGRREFGQPNLGPADGSDNDVGDLFSAFDLGRLIGVTPTLPATYAEIPVGVVRSLPHYGGQGCQVLHITPTDIVNGRLIDPPPADFNPRPGTTPGIPTSGSWTP